MRTLVRELSLRVVAPAAGIARLVFAGKCCLALDGLGPLIQQAKGMIGHGVAVKLMEQAQDALNAGDRERALACMMVVGDTMAYHDFMDGLLALETMTAVIKANPDSSYGQLLDAAA